jgi:hypothetical protein
VADKDWRDEIFADLNNEGYVAIESLGILTGGDIRAAMEAVRQTEANRDEANEWSHIRELQRAKAAWLFGDKSS